MRYLACLAVVLALPTTVLGADLVFEFQGSGEYDSNVFRRPSNPEDDFLFRLRPGVRLEEKHGEDLNYSLRYLAPIELSVDNSKELDNVDQYGNLKLSYKPSGRAEFYGDDVFRYQHGTLLSFATLDSGGVPSIGTSRDRVTTNVASAGVRYQLSESLEADMSMRHQLFESRRADRQDNWMFSLNPNFFYRLNPRHRVGLGVQYSHQDFDASDFAVASQVDSVNAYAQWSWAISSTMGLSVRVGPAYLHSEQDPAPARFVAPIPFQSALYDPGTGQAVPAVVVYELSSCPTAPSGAQYIPAEGCGTVFANPPITQTANPGDYAAVVGQTPISLVSAGNVDDTDDTVDVFAQIELIQNWTPQLTSRFGYERSQGAASGLGGTVIRDSVTASLDWRFRQRWDFSASGAWVNRESLADVNEFFALAGPAGLPSGLAAAAYTGIQEVLATSRQRVETEMWSVSARMSHRLFRKTHVFAQATYTDQDSKAGTLGSGSDFEDWLGIVGVRHEFEPIGLW